MSERLIKLEFQGIKYEFVENPDTLFLVGELFSDNYKIFNKNVTFSDGDIVLDIGANQGVFSIMMSKRFPNIKIHAFEPVPETYYLANRNIMLNEPNNIILYNYGVSGDGKPITINWFPGSTGGASTFVANLTDQHVKSENIPTLRFDEIMKGFDRVRLLKFDCEGAEYDTFYNSTSLDRVDYAVGEIHTNKILRDKGYDINHLATFINNQTTLLYYEWCHMSD
jgi:FkbM family methyltransferase